ncbi:pentapeptide repeat protein [Saccharothrix saharensis]|uniref:Pentapeptide repeat protein n=1 Tax=Saccharothrix saharensis TaxID=571190 RepID=A0A543JNU4_9PSEU|nr:pentapeptide repeat protein [Saccharothrix saharensis]
MSRIGSTYDLSGVLLEREDLQDVTFSTRSMIGARFAGADLRRAAFLSCDVSQADFTGADLRGTTLSACQGNGTVFDGADLREADLRGSSMQLANLRRADLRGADLGYTNLNLVDLSDADLTGARLVGRCAGSPLFGAVLTNALLYGADLTGAVLAARDLDPNRQAAVSAVNLSGSFANEKTKWPAGFDPREAGVTVLDGDRRDEGRKPAWTDPGFEDVTASDPTTWPRSEPWHDFKVPPKPVELALADIAAALERLAAKVS